MASHEPASSSPNHATPPTIPGSSDEINVHSSSQSQDTIKPGANEPVPSAPTPNPRLEALANKKSALEATLATLQAERAALVAESTLSPGLAMPEHWSEDEKAKQALTSAQGVIKEHIALLHKYNELKDMGLGLMGMIADGRGVRVAEIMEEFGVTAKD